ncbi:MAG: hypothetical protein MI743_17190 [Sneathiellales bacterium]|nr:hypothetical protein [Sneathiellales bacterium]
MWFSRLPGTKAVLVIAIVMMSPVVQAALSDVDKDKYILGLSKALKSENYVKANGYLKKLTEGKVPFTPTLDYFAGEIKYHVCNHPHSKFYLDRYVKSEGKNGRYYKDALTLLLAIEDGEKSSHCAKAQAEKANSRKVDYDKSVGDLVAFFNGKLFNFTLSKTYIHTTRTNPKGDKRTDSRTVSARLDETSVCRFEFVSKVTAKTRSSESRYNRNAFSEFKSVADFRVLTKPPSFSDAQEFSTHPKKYYSHSIGHIPKAKVNVKPGNNYSSQMKYFAKSVVNNKKAVDFRFRKIWEYCRSVKGT